MSKENISKMVLKARLSNPPGSQLDMYFHRTACKICCRLGDKKIKQQPLHDKEKVTFLRGHQGLRQKWLLLIRHDWRHGILNFYVLQRFHKPRNNSMLNKDQVNIIQPASFYVIHIF